MKKLTLIFPRFKYTAGDFSLGLASLSAYLKREISDINVTLIDTTFNPDIEYVSEQLNVHKPHITGIYMDTLMSEDALRVAEIAKAHSAYVVTGGPHASILPETIIRNPFVDAVCEGEGEETLKELVEAFYGEKNFDSVKGLWHKRNGNVLQNPPRSPVEDINRLPYPDTDIFDVERYILNFVQLDSYSPNLRGMSVIVSRGCPFHCSYCQPTLNKVHGKKFRIRSPEKVADEISLLKSKYNINAVYFQDDTLTVSKKWIMELCDRLIRSDMRIVWACNTRADVIDREMLEKMREAGLVKIKVGIESITDRIRNGIYRKNITAYHINDLIATAKKLGIQITGFFMLGAPTETKQEIMETIRFAARSDLSEANFSVTVPLPSTGLYALAKEKGWMLPERFGDFDYYHAMRPPMTSSDIASARLEQYKKMAYLYFYLHPKRLLNTLKIVGSFSTVKKTIQKLKRF